MHTSTLSKEWASHIADFQASGMNKAAWCRQQHIAYHQFNYWLKKLQPPDVAQPPLSPTHWLTLDLSDPVEESPPSILIRVNDVIIEVAPHFDPKALLQVIRTLKEL